MSDEIQKIIKARQLPGALSDAVGALLESTGRYVSQEGANWDFKQVWPFSYSDDYFAGIAQLICAFANTHGGIIVFGVHDKYRTGGHNRVSPNLDRLQQALGTLLSEPVELVLRRYETDVPEKAVDVLLVLRHSDAVMPIRFRQKLGP